MLKNLLPLRFNLLAQRENSPEAIGLKIHGQGKTGKKMAMSTVQSHLFLVTLTDEHTGSTWSKVRPAAAMPTQRLAHLFIPKSKRARAAAETSTYPMNEHKNKGRRFESPKEKISRFENSNPTIIQY